MNLHSATSGCINRNGHLCIGLCIIVILYYLPLNYHHFLSIALISIFNVLIFVLSKCQRPVRLFLYNKQVDVDILYHATNELNNSDNNFQIDATEVDQFFFDKEQFQCISRNKINRLVSSSLQVAPL